MARILFVEDEPWFGELYATLFGKQHDVTWLRDGYEAIAQLEHQLPDVLVLDLMLPWANGVQVLHELVSYRDMAHIPVVLFSAALPREMDDATLRAYGVVATLDKLSVKPQKVLQTINGVLKTHANPA